VDPAGSGPGSYLPGVSAPFPFYTVLGV